MAATSVVVLDRGNNTTCTINLHGEYFLKMSVTKAQTFLLSTGILMLLQEDVIIVIRI